MIRSRYVWLTPRDLRRDFGRVDAMVQGEDGASGQLRYAASRRRLRAANMLLAAAGAGLAIGAALLAVKAPGWGVVAVAIGALYATALRLALIARARDRALVHHGAFLPTLARIRVQRAHRQLEMASIRLRHAMMARQGLGDAGDACLAALLRAMGPIAGGAWLASSALPLAAATGGAAAAFGVLASAFAERWQRARALHAEVARTRFTRAASELVSSWPTLRALSSGQGAAERLRRTGALETLERASRANLRVSALFRLAIPALAIGAMLAAAALPPAAVVGLTVLTVAAGQLGAVLGLQLSWAAAARRRRHAADRLIPPLPSTEHMAERIETVAARDLAFRYADSDRPVFEHLGFDLRAGEVLALSSPSGSGKTTLLRLLTGLAEPAAGQVMVNGADARTLAYRHRVAAVFQDEPVGAGTIRAAIAGAAPLDLDAVWDAAARVGVDTLIRELPMQMQTLIVEGPFPPSLLQPLLIARAVVQRPDLLILDEALGALTYERAGELLDTLRAQGTLVIFASHDPGMVALADKVLDLGTA